MEMVVMSADQVRTLMIEAASIALKFYQPPAPTNSDSHPNGDFKWLKSVLPGVPENTLRQWDAAGKIPGSSKQGKRRIYHKQTVLNWIRYPAGLPVNNITIEQQVEDQFNRQLNKKGGMVA